MTAERAAARRAKPMRVDTIRLGQQLPEVNAVVSIVIALTLIPVILAARVAGAGALSRTPRPAEIEEAAEAAEVAGVAVVSGADS